MEFFLSMEFTDRLETYYCKILGNLILINMGRLRHLTNYYLDEKQDVYILVNLKTNPPAIGLA